MCKWKLPKLINFDKDHSIDQLGCNGEVQGRVHSQDWRIITRNYVKAVPMTDIMVFAEQNCPGGLLCLVLHEWELIGIGVLLGDVLLLTYDR